MHIHVNDSDITCTYMYNVHVIRCMCYMMLHGVTWCYMMLHGVT